MKVSAVPVPGWQETQETNAYLISSDVPSHFARYEEITIIF